MAESHPWNDNPANRRISGPPAEPLSYCPSCLNPGTTPDEGKLREYRCERGHQWLATKSQADACGQWQRAYKTSPERNV